MKIKDDVLYSLLIVDDEEIILSGLEEYIDWRALDISTVYTASSADEALDVLREKHVDIVLTDIRMPVHDGLYLTEKIKKDYEDIKVLILSGYNDFEYAKGAIHLGVEDYLLKPVDFNELNKSVIVILKKIEEEKKIRHLKEEFDSQKIDQFFNDLIFGNAKNNTLSSMPVVMPRGNYFVVRMMILDKGILSEHKKNLKKSITHATNMNRDISAYYLFNNMAQELTMIVYTQSETNLEDLYSAILSRISFSVVMGASSQKKSLSNISRAYDEAGDAACYQYIDNDSSIIFYSRIKQNFTKSISENTQVRKCVIELLPQGKHKLSMYLDSLLDKHRKGSGFDPEVYGDLLRAYICIYNYHLRLNVEHHIDVYIHIKRLFSSNTYNEIKLAISDYLDSCYRDDSYNDSIQTSIIEKAKDHIENYYYQNITLNNLSDILYIHPNYLSRLFKEETGQNFSKYLMNVRIDTAKKLLSNKKLRIHQIAEMVGYGSNKYFVKVFKELTGLAPKEYQEKYVEDDET